MKKVLAVLTALIGVTAVAGPASPISAFWIIGNTSEEYNPVLPSPLNPSTIIQQMNWDFQNIGNLSSDRPNGGGWIGFVTATIGDYSSPVTLTYGNATVNWFGTLDVNDATGTTYAYGDIFYCSCNPGATAQAYAWSIPGYGVPAKQWYSRVYIY